MKVDIILVFNLVYIKLFALQRLTLSITSAHAKTTPYAACGNNRQESGRLQTKHNNRLAYGKGEPLESKQPKKGILLRQWTKPFMRWN
jgi:hypothetical protein